MNVTQCLIKELQLRIETDQSMIRFLRGCNGDRSQRIQQLKQDIRERQLLLEKIR